MGTSPTKVMCLTSFHFGDISIEVKANGKFFGRSCTYLYID